MGTVSDIFVFLVEFVCYFWFYVILEVRLHVSSPCGRSGEVRGRHAITFWSRVTKRASSCHTARVCLFRPTFGLRVIDSSSCVHRTRLLGSLPTERPTPWGPDGPVRRVVRRDGRARFYRRGEGALRPKFGTLGARTSVLEQGSCASKKINRHFIIVVRASPPEPVSGASCAEPWLGVYSRSSPRTLCTVMPSRHQPRAPSSLQPLVSIHTCIPQVFHKVQDALLRLARSQGLSEPLAFLHGILRR